MLLLPSVLLLARESNLKPDMTLLIGEYAIGRKCDGVPLLLSSAIRVRTVCSPALLKSSGTLVRLR